jgi:DNA-binding LacI/PurR family transcriptional regulator
VVTIKELAAFTGLSASTVSLVLRGEAQKRSIPQKTQDKIWRAVKEHNYRPNISARRLRSKKTGGLIIAVFWTSDFRTPLMVRFLKGIQEALVESGQNLEIIIHPYRANELSKEHSLAEMNMFNAAILGNMSPADMEYLESASFRMPIVLHNRISEKFCTAYVDEYRMGSMAAEVFASRGCRTSAVLTAQTPFHRWAERTRGFTETCEKLGIHVIKTFTMDYTAEGGYRGGLGVAGLPRLPASLFCSSDALALGALRAFYKKDISIPRDIKIITTGNGDPDSEEFAYTSLSSVVFPIEDMAGACLSLLLDVINGKAAPPCSREIPTYYIPRESCGPLAGKS